jgi:hypothetical protein
MSRDGKHDRVNSLKLNTLGNEVKEAADHLSSSFTVVSQRNDAFDRNHRMHPQTHSSHRFMT